MRKTNRELIFERMGLSSPKFETNKPIEEVNVPNSQSINQVFSFYEQQDHFPAYTSTGIQFLRVSENEQEFEKFKQQMDDAWKNISLPFGESKEHKKRGTIKGVWGVDDDNDGIVDGASDGGFGGDGGGGE